MRNPARATGASTPDRLIGASKTILPLCHQTGRVSTLPCNPHSKAVAIGTAIATIASLFRVGCMSGGHGVKRMTGAEGSATSPGGGGCPGPQPEAASTGSRPRQLEPWRGCFPVAGSAPRSTRPTGYMRPVCGKPRRRPVQAGCPPAGTIPIPATQGRLRQPTPTDRPAASTVGNNSSP